jgi:RND family efflux transporter MFP subunit
MRFEKFHKSRALMAAALLCLAVVTAGCGKKPAPPPPVIPEVVTAKVVKKTMLISDDFCGSIESVRVVNIVPRVTGYIEKCYYTEGSMVKENDPLYLIDPRPYQAKLDAARGQLKVDQSKLAFAQLQADRYTTLVNEQATSVEKMQDMISQRDQSAAAVAKDQADVRDAELNLSFTAINAPFTGRIQKMNIDVGNLVEMQKSVLTTLIQMDPVYINFSFSRAKGFNVQLMERAKLLFPLKDMIIRITLPNGEIYPVDGKVNYISYLIDKTTDCITARGIIANRVNPDYGFELIPGQYAPVKLIYGENPNALVVPDSAVVQSQIGDQVCVVGADNKITMRNVKLGVSHDGVREITEGVKEGESVVTEGVQKVRTGMTVKPVAK